MLLPLLCLALPSPLPVVPAPVEIREWPVPWADSRPRDPDVAPDGKIWFVGQVGNYIARLDAATGEFKRFELDPGVHPHNLIVDKSGIVWYAGNQASHIGRLDPGDGKITKYPMPDPAVRDPHTLVFDRNGDIWFTAQGANVVGKLTVATGAVRLIAVPTPRARPYGIWIDSKNRPWFNEFGTNKLATVDPVTFELREHQLPDAGARGRRIAITSDDRIFYVDYARGTLARFDAATGTVEEWPCPGGAAARPYAMTVDDRDRLWLVETGARPNRLVGFDPKTKEFFGATDIPSGGGTVRHMVFHRPTREIWFGTDVNTIGRAKLP
ncbi:MAG: virginiamycin B lyase family protein [Acidimicrobiales bacterium]